MVRKSTRLWKGTVVDGRGHLMGRLAAIVAKQLLRGEKIAVVRCEEMNVSQGLQRNKYRMANWMHKKHLTNPKKGPFHYRGPRKMFWRVVRGMLPYRTNNGMAALNRMKVFEGIPPPFDRKKRVVCPQALRVLRLAPGRKFCRLGDLAKLIGWKHDDLLQELEAKRKAKADAWWKKKTELDRLHKAAIKIVDKVIPKVKYGDACVIGSL